MKQAFTQSENGFTLLFANEWSVSVQWSKHLLSCDGGVTTAEVAVLDPDGMFWTVVDDRLEQTDDVMPHTTSEELVNIINITAAKLSLP